MPESPIQTFLIASANFGGGARVVPVAGGGTVDRSKAVVDFICAPSGNKAIDALPLVIGFQEMTKLLKVKPPATPHNYPEEIVNQLTVKDYRIDEYYVPTLTTKWYPMGTKWGPRWEEGIEDMEQGMLTCAKNAHLVDPWADPTRRSHYHGRRIDLPTQEVIPEFTSASDNQLLGGQYKGTYYQGNRDTEPRATIAHGVSIAAEDDAQFLFLNVHLTTLKAEDTGTLKFGHADQAKRTVRQPSLDGMIQRRLQLLVIHNFILEAYEELKLPVIVAGDFNADVAAKEMKDFLGAATFMKPVFQQSPDQCWHCGCPTPRSASPVAYFTAPNGKTILAKTPKEVAALLGSSDVHPCPISANECCSNCQAPFFTHKRNFGLIDNILYTDSEKATNLKWRLSPASDSEQVTRGIRLDTYFSDHLPLWCKFEIQPA